MNVQQQQALVKKGYEAWGKNRITNQDHKDIIAMCLKHDFQYTWQVVSELMTQTMAGIVRTNAKMLPKVIKNSKGEKFGFYIFYKYLDVKGKGEIKYIFIKPEHRRKGYAKTIIKKLQSTKFTDIYTDSTNESYMTLVKNLGFKDIGVCDNGVETCFHWSKTGESKPLIEHQYDTGKPRP